MTDSNIADGAAIAVIGAGAMGAGIAEVAVRHGHPCHLYDLNEEALNAGRARIEKSLGRQVEKGKLDPDARDDALARLSLTKSLDDLSGTALVIEAIVENLEVKRKLFAELEDICGESCLLASNTSSLSISAIAAGMKRPANILGMHFFNPAPVMKLVEIVRGLASDASACDALDDLSRRWGKTPIQVKSSPGFVTNRTARPFYGEAVQLVQEGAASPAEIDRLFRAQGFRMGPLELIDFVGQDISYAVTSSLFDAFKGEPRFRPTQLQREMLDAGWLGRKSGRGFHDYSGEPDRGEPAPLPEAGDIRPAINPRVAHAHPVFRALAGQEGLLDDPLLVIDECRLPGGAILRATDGRLAAEHRREAGVDVVLLDAVISENLPSELAFATAAGDAPVLEARRVLSSLEISGLAMSDSPGLAVARMAAMLVNEAAEVLLTGVTDEAALDPALKLGLNFPVGPMELGERLGWARALTLLENMEAAYGNGRHRQSLWLRRKVLGG